MQWPHCSTLLRSRNVPLCQSASSGSSTNSRSKSVRSSLLSVAHNTKFGLRSSVLGPGSNSVRFHRGFIPDTAAMDSEFQADDLGFLPLELAVSNGDITTVKTLLDAGINVNIWASCYTNLTALHLAAKQGHLEI